MSNQSFTHTVLPIINKKVHRLGLAFNFGIGPEAVEKALEQGVNYLFWTQFRTGANFEVVKEALKKDRKKYVFATGASMGFFGGGVRRGAEKMLKKFDLDCIDVFQLFWLGKTSAFTKGVENELIKLKEEGLIKTIGVSIHNRPRAGKLAQDSIFDLLMLRYNVAHPGVEKDVFSHYNKPPNNNRPLTVAYTATAWKKLLTPPKGWGGATMQAGDCYRFCLSNPNVDVVLCGPGSQMQLTANLKALNKGPLSTTEEKWMRKYGKLVHG